MTTTPQFKALTLFIAAFGALNLAMALELSNPYWAAMPVWVVSQPWREDILIRGVLRIVGTLVGAVIGIGVLLLTDSTALHILAMGITVGGFVALTYWIGTVYSYGAMLAAITPMVILLPAVATQHDPIALGIDRAWCTLIGVVSVTLTTAIFTPRRTEKLPLHTDHGRDKTWRRGAFAAVMTLIAVLVGELGGGIIALSAGLAIAMFSILMASMPDPRPMLTYLLPGAAIGVLAGLAYRLLQQTYDLQGVALLTLTGAFMAGLSWLRANPRTAPLGLDANMIFLLTAEIGGPGHSLANQGLGTIALMCGAIGLVWLYGRMLDRQIL